jgi:hypothetical protein
VQGVNSETTGWLAQTKYCSSNRYAYNTACNFLNRILNSAMAIRRQQLHDLQQHGATQNDQARERNVPRIG